MADQPESAPAPAPEPAPAPAPEPAPEPETQTDAVTTEPSPPPEPAPLPTISLQDILNSVELAQAREAADKTKLEAIGTISFDSLRSSLLQWATRGFPNAYVIHEVPMVAPAVCSDGVTRSLTDYIQFCSGKTIAEHVDVLHQRTPDIEVSFAYTGTTILIVVSRLG
jgi:hypothetical protein